MTKFRVTVYQSYTYEIDAETEQEASDWQDCPELAYEFICDSGAEPIDFGTDDVTVKEITE